MTARTILAVAIWATVVGGNIFQTIMQPPETFMNAPRLPWLIVLMPVVVVVGALFRRGHPGEAKLGNWVDRQFGPGAYREFMDVLKLELLFATMCLSIVFAALARSAISGVSVMPPEIIGFFASGSVAFLVAYFIRQGRERDRRSN